MRLRELLVGAALLIIALVLAKANKPVPKGNAPRDGEMRTSKAATDADSVNDPVSERVMTGIRTDRELLAAVPSPLVYQDKAFGSAYFNTLSILSSSNTCSDFFGGPSAAIDVFKQLAGRVKKDHFATSVGMTMSGEIVSVFNELTKQEYRLFDKVSLNANGPFYRKPVSNLEGVAGVGSYEANTKEVRVLMFLHELGHVLKGEDGNWLLPNDGKNEALSRQNTRRIEEVCGDQIESLNSPDHDRVASLRDEPDQ